MPSPPSWLPPRCKRHDGAGQRGVAHRDISERDLVSVGLGEVARQIPLDEPPPLPRNAELTVIGRSVPRQSGRAKVTGTARFTVDVALPHMLYGCILRSSLPHAKIRAIDVIAAVRYPGVRAVFPIVRPV